MINMYLLEIDSNKRLWGESDSGGCVAASGYKMATEFPRTLRIA